MRKVKGLVSNFGALAHKGEPRQGGRMNAA